MNFILAVFTSLILLNAHLAQACSDYWVGCFGYYECWRCREECNFIASNANCDLNAGNEIDCVYDKAACGEYTRGCICHML